MDDKIQIFDRQRVRSVWDGEREKWYVSVIDVIAVLTESTRPRKYWDDLKRKLQAEGSELSEKIGQLKLLAPDGKKRMTDVADVEQLFRLIQSIPSPKVEPFKLWLAQLGRERLDETLDPEISIDRAVQNYRRLGYPESWINQRIKSIEIRKGLTDEWNRAGVAEGDEYAILTDLMTKTWSGMTTKEYRRHKDLKKENLRDNMTNLELVINMLAEATATELSAKHAPQGLYQSSVVARKGADVAKNARREIEQQGGEVISAKNAKQLGKRNGTKALGENQKDIIQ